MFEISKGYYFGPGASVGVRVDAQHCIEEMVEIIRAVSPDAGTRGGSRIGDLELYWFSYWRRGHVQFYLRRPLPADMVRRVIEKEVTDPHKLAWVELPNLVRIDSCPWGNDAPEPAEQPVVYFILAGGNSVIKIGCTNSLSRRLIALQSGSPTHLVTLATIPGGVAEEADLHRRFAEWRWRGEWFCAADELVDHIISLLRVDARGAR